MTDTLPDSPESTADFLARAAVAFKPSTNIDGWTGARQKRFLEAIADGETVIDACGLVCLSPQSAYAFRRRAKGRAFDLGWKGADLLARERVAARLFLRASEGQEVTITRPDGSEMTKHHYDNRLALTMLARLDRYADAAENTAPGHSARLVAGDFDAYLDMIGAEGGPARAGLFMLAHGDTPASELEPIVALARADRHLRCGTLAPDVATADLDPARRADWTAEQWARAEAAGLLVLAPPVQPEPAPAQPASDCQPVSTSADAEPDDEPVWWDEYAGEGEGAWRTRFPPPEGFLGEEDGEYGREGYARELDPDEIEQLEAAERAAIAPRRAQDEAERDRWFAACAAQAAAAPPIAPAADPSADRADLAAHEDAPERPAAPSVEPHPTCGEGDSHGLQEA